MVSCSSARNATESKFADNPVVAHRGAFKKNNHPENSIAALREAIRLGCTGAEFDVRMSADNVLLINHDPHYNGLDIEKTNYQQLAQTKLPNGEALPTLRDYLTVGLQNNTVTQLVVEIKPSASRQRGKEIAEHVFNLVKELGAEKRVSYISFDIDILKKLEELDKACITQYLNGDLSPAQLAATGIDGADYHFSVFRKNPQWIEEAKKMKLLLNAWTVNDEADMRWLLSQHFDFITTNEPELLLSLLAK
jgi:glycerophosphoryl diester phosphodiesterase